MRRFFDTKRMSGIVMASLMSFLLVALFAHAATTISTNITTGGTLSVTGASTFTGASNFTGAIWATSTLQATGATVLYSTLRVDGAGTFNGNVTLGDAAVDAIVVTGNASTTNSLTVGNNLYITNLASSSQLIVGGDNTNGTVSGMLLGICNLTSTSIAASTTQNFACTGANGVRVNDKVFVNATSSLVSGSYVHGVVIRAASSSVANQINVDIWNPGSSFGAATIAGTLQFWAVR